VGDRKKHGHGQLDDGIVKYGDVSGLENASRRRPRGEPAQEEVRETPVYGEPSAGMEGESRVMAGCQMHYHQRVCGAMKAVYSTGHPGEGTVSKLANSCKNGSRICTVHYQWVCRLERGI
jgi:3-hydroxyisobutyrate dehydrogenase-like beta-hydroxyacid dehydrogenase